MNVTELHFDRLLDAKGLKCPMPVVKARKEILAIEPGQVLKIVSTDRGSVKDFQGWAKVAKNAELVAQDTEADSGSDLYVHYVKRLS